MHRVTLRLSARWSPARARWCSSGSAAYKEILTERRPGGVGLITLNREKQLNALTPTLTKELVAAAKEFDADPEIGAIVVTGSGSKAFAAGADIKTMASLSYMDMYKGQIFSELDDLSKVRKPVIAAVNGFALGGGCELAMACDFILASDTAKFGQPEIKLGTIPGLGGTQRFTRALGKARAMELCLTGGLIGAEEAVSRGLASRVVPAAELLDDALTTAATIAGMSQPIVAIAKTCVNVAFESSLAEGLRLERALFYSTFATQDQKLGMKAFVEKAEPAFKHE
jgi:enoyl-CoA hydratase/carnithine racemase